MLPKLRVNPLSYHLPFDAWRDAKVAKTTSSYRAGFGVGASDFRKLTSCQRCGSGSLDQTGMPRRTTPFVRIQKSVPGVACCTGSEGRLFRLARLLPCRRGTRRNAVRIGFIQRQPHQDRFPMGCSEHCFPGSSPEFSVDGFFLLFLRHRLSSARRRREPRAKGQEWTTRAYKDARALCIIISGLQTSGRPCHRIRRIRGRGPSAEGTCDYYRSIRSRAKSARSSPRAGSRPATGAR